MLPEGRVTFLFTDIEGSTRLFRSLGEEYVTVLDECWERGWNQPLDILIQEARGAA